MAQANPNRQKVVIIFTGGTISMKIDPTFGGIQPALSAQEILDLSPSLHKLADIVLHEFGAYPGPHFTPTMMLDLGEIVRGYLRDDEIAGVVITHGTDTLEETACFLDCYLDSPKPVVVVGSMRNASDLDWDGPRNLRDSVLLATSPRARNMGVLVCLAETVHAASEVSKVDTSNIQTFESVDFGPLGRVVQGAVQIYRSAVHRDTIPVTTIPRLVPILTTYSGQETEIAEFIVNQKPDGIVVEAMGVGNVPPTVAPILMKAASDGIPVIVVSRCLVGRVERIYSYDGAGKMLYEAGLIFADYINAQKARIKLLMAVGANIDKQELRDIFEWSHVD